MTIGVQERNGRDGIAWRRSANSVLNSNGNLIMTTRIYIRKPDAGDEQGLAVLCGQLGYPSSAQETAERLRLLRDRDDHLVLLATGEANAPVGWIHAYVAYHVETDAFVEIGGMVVSEEHRGTGIGTRLLGKVEQWARSKKVSAIRVRSNVAREHAHGFYESAGYPKTKTTHVFQKPL